jgi:hypothetical protein
MKTERSHRKAAHAALISVTSLILAMSVSAQTPDQAPQAKTTSGAIQASVLGTLLPSAAGTFFILDGAQGSGAKAGEVALGIGIGAVGVILGPSFGHAYAERPQPMKGAWLRFAGAAVGGLGLAGMGMSNSYGNSATPQAFAFMGLGGVLYLYGAISDMATLGNSVEQYNQSHGFSGVKVNPCYYAQHEAIGLELSIGIN